MTVADSEKWALQMDRHLAHGSSANVSVYIVPSKFCVMQFIHESRYRESYKLKGEKGKGSAVRKANVRLGEA